MTLATGEVVGFQGVRQKKRGELSLCPDFRQVFERCNYSLSSDTFMIGSAAAPFNKKEVRNFRIFWVRGESRPESPRGREWRRPRGDWDGGPIWELDKVLNLGFLKRAWWWDIKCS
jgi:hypothetical protein